MKSSTTQLNIAPGRGHCELWRTIQPGVRKSPASAGRHENPSVTQRGRIYCHPDGDILPVWCQRFNDVTNRGYTYTNRIDADSDGETLLHFYVSRYTHSTEQEWRDRIDRGEVQLNDHRAQSETRLVKGDTLTYRREPWSEPDAPLSFDTLYEDPHLLAVDKPGGLPVLPGGHHLAHTLLALVRQRYPGDVEPSPLHRLGRGTSGIVLFARSPDALRVMTETFVERRIVKIYRALVIGTDLPDTFVIDHPIGPVPYAPLGTLHAATSDGKASHSEGRRLYEDRSRNTTLVEISITTGRPHQIRIHAAAFGHPLVGDPLYTVGGVPRSVDKNTRASLPGDVGYHLHAYRVAFPHPVDSTPVQIVSPPPSDLRTPEEKKNGE